jgi:membrane-bound ClpP family serine protease
MSSAATNAGTCRTYKNWPAAGVLVAALLVSVPTPTSAMPEHAVVLEIDGVIGPATTDYVTRKFGAMKPADIGLIILRVNTPGGLESSMREIIRAVLSSPTQSRLSCDWLTGDELQQVILAERRARRGR